MNKLTKIGCSALCGSLAAVSAVNAGSIDVSGSATATWISKEGAVTGNPIGVNSGLTFSGSGELDNGTTFSLTLTQADQAAWSAGSIAITLPSMGSITIGSGHGGNGIDAFDDAVPTAWEETDGTGLSISHNKISGVGGSMNVQYKTPEIMGSTLAIAYAPRNDGTQNSDKASSGTTTRFGSGMDYMLDLNKNNWMMLPNVYVGYSRTNTGNDPKTGAGTNSDKEEDHEEGVIGGKIKIGPLVAGAQVTGEWLGNTQAVSDVAGYKNVAYGIAFNVNDDLSISYGYSDTKKGFVSNDAGNETVRGEATSFQIAYTMGGMSIKFAETDVDNAGYTTGTTNDREATTIALSLAF